MAILYRDSGTGRAQVERGELAGLPVLWGILPEGGRRQSREAVRLERQLRRAGAGRYIALPDFPEEHLPGALKAVDTLPLCRDAADVLALGWLEGHGLVPGRSTVCLASRRVSPELMAAAERLCRCVRAVRVDVPGEGERCSALLRSRWGIPQLPESAAGDVTVSFSEGCPGQLRLWGSVPELGGLRLTADLPEIAPPLELPLLALLWEQGKVKREEFRAFLG